MAASNNNIEGIVKRFDERQMNAVRLEKRRQDGYIRHMLRVSQDLEEIYVDKDDVTVERDCTLDTGVGIHLNVPMGDECVISGDHLSFQEDTGTEDRLFFANLKATCEEKFNPLEGINIFDVLCEAYDATIKNERLSRNSRERRGIARKLSLHRLRELIEAQTEAKEEVKRKGARTNTKIALGIIAAAASIWNHWR